MSEMVERAALGLFNCSREEWLLKSEDFRTVALKDVRRMIEAMREPTEGMVAVVYGNHGEESGSDKPARDTWQAMIDEALR